MKIANTLLSKLTTEVIERKTNGDPQSLIDPFVSMFRALAILKDAFSEYPKARYWLETSRNGAECMRVQGKYDQDIASGNPLPKFHTNIYEKLLLPLAEIDKRLFEVVRDGYDEIIELAHYRNTLIDFLVGDVEEPFLEMTKDFLTNDFIQEREEYFESLDTLYRNLTGNHLEVWKLR